ncbi:MAG TPA: hypothetical protein PLG50_01340 [bacterium]|nr:hypothetical protein [bacterium]HQG44287.1 hypothetical protein [bacterium]HQI47677.1 hypothetical protein [bacterium]HQJ63358.1 hypothetical protein [bacterium]
MNLLIDQREPSDLQEPDWTPQPEEPPAAPILEEPTMTRSPETPLDYYNFEEPEGHKRGILGPILIILLLLAAIGAAAYYGFFYRPQELGDFHKAAQTTSPATNETAPAVSTPVPVESAPAVVTPAGNAAVQESPSTSVPTTKPRETAVTPPAESTSGSPLASAAALLGGILAARPADLQVSTLILDPNSFSAEVSAGSRSVIENYTTALKNNVRGGLNASPSSGYYSGARALVTGSFPELNTATTPVIDSQGLVQIRQGLRTAANAEGLKVIEISQAREMVRDGAAWTPIFVKVTGREEQFESYCTRLAAELPLMRLEKIILQARGQEVAAVIRFEAQTR